MNTKAKKFVAAISMLSASLSFAADNENAQDDRIVQFPDYQVRGVGGVPALTKKVVPRVSSKLVGSSVVLKFDISKSGKPISVDTEKPLHSLRYPRDRDFAVQMIGAVKNWKFETPLGSDGQPRSISVLMPIKVVERGGSTQVLASLKPVFGY